MSVLLVIPARYASTRFPGKPLAMLTGAGGVEKSLIERSWDAAMAVNGVDRVVIATDSPEIARAGEAFGAEIVMTSVECRNGTERCAEAFERLGGGYDVVVNLQGDAPLTPAWFVEDLVAGLLARPEMDMATPALCCSAEALAGFQADRRAGRVGGTTVVFDKAHQALYFSKEVLPFQPDNTAGGAYHHVGVYAYRPEGLRAYATAAETDLEKMEGLEQLRFLYHGMKVLCVEVDAKGRHFWELNNPEDRPIIERALADLGIE